MDQKEKDKVAKVLRLAFGYPYQVTKDIKSIPVTLRTLYDSEMAEALSRSMQLTNVEEQLFALKRWRLAYSLININATDMPPVLEERYGIISSWLNYFVEQAYTLFEEICAEEDELLDIVKEIYTKHDQE